MSIRTSLIGCAALALLLIGVEAVSAAPRVGFVGGYYGPGVGVGVGYGYRSFGYAYPSYGFGYYPGIYNRSYYNTGIYQPYNTFRYYNYYTPRLITPTYVPYSYSSFGTPSYGTSIYNLPRYNSAATTPAPAQHRLPENAALVTVNVPADAEIWFSGNKTNKTGAVREFETPPLEPGANYSYVVRARWMENGKEVDQTKKVAVHANDRVNVSFE